MLINLTESTEIKTVLPDFIFKKWENVNELQNNNKAQRKKARNEVVFSKYCNYRLPGPIYGKE